jgi:VIT1/CCC1 family predicted Fe2+/Mn2+ transporter
MADDERGHARAISRLIGGSKPDPREQIAGREGWHRGDRSGALRAGVFGVSDGLVFNTSLVMGFAGLGAARTYRVAGALLTSDELIERLARIAAELPCI